MDARAAADFANHLPDDATTPLLPAFLHRFGAWMIWAAMTAAALYLVLRHGIHVPMMDEYQYLVPVLIGEEPFTLSWLGQFYYNNLIPFAKLMNVAILNATGHNFRAAPLVSTLWLAGLSAGFIRTAQRLRGRASLCDGVFPLLLLGWQHWENFAWTMTLAYTAAHVLIGTVLLILLRYQQVPFGMAVLAGTLVAVMPFFSPPAVAHVPVLVLWLLARAGKELLGRRRGDWARGSLLLLLAAFATVNTAYYFLAYQPDVSGTSAPETMELVTGVFQLLGMGLASDHVSMMTLGEAGGLAFWVVTSTLVTVLGAAGALLFAYVWVTSPPERFRVLALVLFCGGAFALFIMLSRARIAEGPLYAQPRYALFSMPLLCCLYCVWVRYGPGWTRSVVALILFLAASACAPLNFRYGWNYVTGIHAALEAFLDDLRAGKPSFVAVDDHYQAVVGAPGEDRALDEAVADLIAGRIRRMNELGIPPFDTVPPDPETAVIATKLPKPAATKNVHRKGTHWVGQDRMSFVEFRLPQPRFVLAIRMRYRLVNDTGMPASGTLYWRESGVTQYAAEERNATLRLVPQPADKEEPDTYRAWAWVNGRLDHFRLYPDEAPFEIRIEEISLLVPR